MNIPVNSFSTVKSIEIVADMGGDRIEITLKNGRIIVVAPDNDALFVKRNELQDDPELLVLCDMGGGHNDGDEMTIILKRKAKVSME